MSKKYKLEYLPIAQEDLFDIFEYVKKDKPNAAANFIVKIDKFISQLKSFPFMGTIPKDDRLQLLGYRMLVIENYLVFYVIKNNIVEIRRIIHGSRRYSFLM